MSKRIFFFVALKLFLFIIILNIAFSNTKIKKNVKLNKIMNSSFRSFGIDKSFSQSSIISSSSSSESSNINGKKKIK